MEFSSARLLLFSRIHKKTRHRLEKLFKELIKTQRRSILFYFIFYFIRLNDDTGIRASFY